MLEGAVMMGVVNGMLSFDIILLGRQHYTFFILLHDIVL